MAGLGKFSYVMVVILVLKCFTLTNGISNREKLHSEEEKRTVESESKNEIFSSREDSAGKSKRGIIPIGDNRRRFGDRDGSSGYGDYEPGRYGGSGGGYPPAGIGHYDDRYEPDGGYHHSGGGRPSGYEPSYGHSYGPPHGSSYPGGYEDEHHYQGSSGGGDQGIGGYTKALSLKKILLPLAGLAILGVAAAASHNPVLLQLGSISGRRRRSLQQSDIYPSNPVVKPIKIK